uniref:Putative geminin n=2 Tax=Anopheles triannulatus TaxID=58253 RepID=A0A2M4AX69_9DIPT
MSGKGLNIVIPLEPAAEQEEATKTARRTLKDVQNVVASQKENFSSHHLMAHAMSKDLLLAPSKVALEVKAAKTSVSRATQTTFAAETKLTDPDISGEIAQKLDEKRRNALQETLKENQELTMKVEMLENELTHAKGVIAHFEDLVGVMNEMLSECSCQASTSGESSFATKVTDSVAEGDSGIAPNLDPDSDESEESSKQ